jgi:hypothetical protein
VTCPSCKRANEGFARASTVNISRVTCDKNKVHLSFVTIFSPLCMPVECARILAPAKSLLSLFAIVAARDSEQRCPSVLVPALHMPDGKWNEPQWTTHQSPAGYR